MESKINRRNSIRRKKPEMERNVVQNEDKTSIIDMDGDIPITLSSDFLNPTFLFSAPENAETGLIGRRSLSFAANHLLIETTLIIYS